MSAVNFSRILSLLSILKAPLPQIDWLVDPLIAHGNRVMFFGESGCGKSWLMLDLAIALSLGKPWLGHYAIPQSRTVLYLDEEMSKKVLQRRLKQLSGGIEVDAPDQLWFGSHLGIHFTEAMDTQALLSDLKNEGIDPEVIIVDTFRRVFTGNENDAGEVGRFWDSIEPILAAGKTLIVSHHMKKPSQNGPLSLKHMASGSTNIVGQLDAAYAVTREAKNAINLECVKSRDTEEPSPFMVGLYDLAGPEPRVELRFLSTKEDIEESPLMVNQGVQLIADLVEGTEQEKYQSKDLKDFLASKGFAERTAERVLQAYSTQGVLEKVSKGVWQRKTLAPAA